MNVQSADTVSRSPAAGEQYWCRFDLLDRLLRDSHFSTSPDRWQNAHDLVLKLLDAGQLPDDPLQLRPLLAPLFCRSAREQALFGELFDQWLRLVRPQAQKTTADDGSDPRLTPVKPPLKKPLQPVIAGALLVLVLIAMTAYFLSKEPELSEAANPITPPTQTKSGDEPGIKPAPEIEELELQPVPPRRPLETPKLDVVHRAYVGAGHWLIRLFPALIGIVWLVLLWRGWQLVLERRRGERQQQDPLHAITLAAAADELLDSSALRGALRRLHTAVAYPTRRLNLDATVTATARHAGLLQPVFADRMAVPECVVLVDYRHDADQMAALGQLACQRLKEAGLTIHRYRYQQDPRRIYEEAGAGPGRWLSLGELAGRYPDARLLLIGEPAALIDPWRVTLRPWAEVLAWWPQRGLLATRLPRLDWQRALESEGLAVADLSSDGLANMAEHLAGLPPPV